MNRSIIFLLFVLIFSVSCNNNDNQDCIKDDFFSEYSSRNFKMGFSTWAYAPTVEAVNNTYKFIRENADIYSEHIDYKIPWNAWINDLSLPVEFTNEIDSRISKRISNIKLALSVSLLNNERSDLAEDYDGNTPEYSKLSDINIENAYFKHIQYLTSRFNPDYLIIAIEVNELYLRSPEKWGDYKVLISNVKNRLKQEYPELMVSESITLHNLYKPDIPNSQKYIDEIIEYANNMDFVAISFYPFFKGMHSEKDFQKAFDFLHDKITRPIAFAETSHLSEDLSIDSYDLFIKSNECEQNAYLETLTLNAQKQDYEYIIWWAHRDFQKLWETFPEELKDLGKLWRNTGLILDNGNSKKAYYTWKTVYEK